MKFQTQEDVTGRVRPKAYGDPTQTELGSDALRAVDLVGVGGQRSGRTPRATRSIEAESSGMGDLRPRAHRTT